MEGYLEVLHIKIVPWMWCIAHNHAWPFIFQQYSAPTRIAWATTKFLDKKNVPIWPRNFWPTNGPDFAPPDYGNWPMVVQGAC